MVTLQSTNLSETQCRLVPDLGADGNFNFVRAQRIRIVLMELDSAEGKWTMGVEEKSAIGEWKLESGVRGVLWSMRALVGMMGLVGMTRPVGPVGVTRLVGGTRFVWMIGFMRRIGMVRVMGRLGLIGRVGWFGVTVMTFPAMMPYLLRFGPFSELVAFQFLVGIESGLYRLSALQVVGKSGRLYQ